jgi:hypothetical protein
MTEIRYGLREGPGRGREIKLAADQYFHRRGGHFVYLADGAVTLCASPGALVAGWAESPKDTAGKSSWKSSATAGDDKLFIITGLDNVFEIPADESKASCAASMIGEPAKIVETGATHSMIQKAKPGTTNTGSSLSIVDYDSTNKTYFVRIKPDSLQAI